MNLRTINRFVFPVLMMVFFTISCDENADNIAEITGKDPFESTILDDASLASALNGMYSAMNDQTSFGQYVPVIGDLMSDNAFVSSENTNRFTTTNDYNWTENSGDYISLWEQLYDVIAQANVVIEYSELIEIEDQDYVNDLVGQAYIGRAFSLFYLTVYWAQSPTSNIQPDKGIMLPVLYNSNQDLPRSAVSASWEQIESDLLMALSLMSTEPGSTMFGPTAANILLSRVYLWLEEYDRVITYADAAINNSSYSSIPKADYVSSWVDESSPEVVFQLSYSTGDNLTLNGLASIYDDGGYGDIMFRESLYNSFDNSDVRQDLLTVSDRTIDIPIGYWTLKFPYDAGLDGVGQLDIRLLRMSEAWLNKIEALYYTSPADALIELNEFAATRHDIIYTETGPALLATILKERQLEFFAEGMRFLDLKRNEMDIIEGTNCIQVCAVTYPNDFYAFPIPLTEINSNTSISNVDQNPGY